jgi:hypothetical protein
MYEIAVCMISPANSASGDDDDSICFSGGIRTKIGTFSYFVTFELECLSYSLIWATTKKTLDDDGDKDDI